jgi:cysteine desulfurase
MKRIYLDWNATTPLDARVLDRMMPYLREQFGNPSSLHEQGREARRAVEDARESIASAIGADAREIVFCSGATEANNLALLGLAGDRPGAVVVSAIEHPSVLECAESMTRHGREAVVLPVTPAGRVDLGTLEGALARRPALVAVMAANNETGMIQPTAAAAAACAAAGVPLHVDAVQTLGKLSWRIPHEAVATASFSAHKVGGPKGIGALFARVGSRIERQIHGGGQERGRRSGTENVPAIVGFGAAVELACAEIEARRARLRALERLFLRSLAARDVRCVVHGDPDENQRLPGTLNVRFPGFSGEGMLFGLDLLGVSVSLGSACSSGAARPSHVLAAMGIPKQENLESVRFSLGPSLADSDVESAAQAVASVVRRTAFPP